MFRIIFILTYLIFQFCKCDDNRNQIINSDDNGDIVSAEIKCLRDLSLLELYRIRQSFDKLQCDSCDEPLKNEINDVEIESRTFSEINNESSGNGSIVALPFISRLKKWFNGGGSGNEDLFDRSYEHHQSWEEKKPTKLQTVFQLSITTLSFLAFGGYLLCMIVQAIKSKGTTYFHPMAGTQQSAIRSPLKKIKIYRRQRREIIESLKLSNNRKINQFENTTKILNDKKMASPNPEDMYKILVLFAEGYVKLADI